MIVFIEVQIGITMLAGYSQQKQKGIDTASLARTQAKKFLTEL
jgi:hypothetical protein